jgi:hypothetical protein
MPAFLIYNVNLGEDLGTYEAAVVAGYGVTMEEARGELEITEERQS